MRGNSRVAAKRRPGRKAVFLEALVDTVNVTLSCRRAGVPRRTVYDWRQEDGEFARAWDEAVEEGVDLLEAELHRRAFEGVEKPVFYKGEQVGTVRQYSDQLAMFLLRAHRPRRYKDFEPEARLPGGIDEATRRQVIWGFLTELSSREQQAEQDAFERHRAAERARLAGVALDPDPDPRP